MRPARSCFPPSTRRRAGFAIRSGRWRRRSICRARTWDCRGRSIRLCWVPSNGKGGQTGPGGPTGIDRRQASDAAAEGPRLAGLSFHEGAGASRGDSSGEYPDRRRTAALHSTPNGKPWLFRPSVAGIVRFSGRIGPDRACAF